MTSKQLFEFALIELNKKEAPSLLLEDYNYFINKAINQFINKVYNAYDINQQKSDDLRVLKSTAVLTPTLNNDYSQALASSLFKATYEVDLPDDYLHILNCVVEYQLLQNYKCYNKDTLWHQGAKRLTADMFSQVINNYYLRPSYKNPYFYINNVTTDVTYPITEAPTPISIGTTVTDSWLITYAASAGTLTIVKNGVSSTFTYAASGLVANQYTTIVQLAGLINGLGIPTIQVGSTTLLINNAIALGISGATDVSGTSGITVASGPTTNTTLDTYIIGFATGTDIVTIVKNGVSYAFTYNSGTPGVNEYKTQANLVTLINALEIPTVEIGTNIVINGATALGITGITQTTSALTITTGPASPSTETLVQRVADYRYGNRSKVRMEIRYGKDASTFLLQKVYIDYLKAPQFIRLTQEQVDAVEDNSQLLEFPDYVSQEIVNELIHLLMENASDPRLQTHIPINQSIAQPGGDQPQHKK